MDLATKKTPQNNKCVFRDPRYGLVYDVWKNPSEEALSGGRQMFCVVPLANAMTKSAAQAISLLASSALQVLQNPDSFKPELLQTNMDRQLKRVASSVKKPQFDLGMMMRTRPLSSSSSEKNNQIKNIFDGPMTKSSGPSVFNVRRIMSTFYIPDHVLVRLPFDSLRRFRCVSKSWSDLISSSYFSVDASHKKLRLQKGDSVG